MKKLKIQNNALFDQEVNTSFETLMNNIDYYGSTFKTIAISSCKDREGKSFIAFQAARVLATSGKRVVLVMADFRKTMGNGVRTLPGLAEVLNGDMDLEDAVYETDLEDLHLFFSGGSIDEQNKVIDPVGFSTIMNYFRRTYDIIVVDTPTVGKTANDGTIYNECDGSILVVEPNRVSGKLAKYIRRIIENTGCLIFGVVLNYRKPL